MQRANASTLLSDLPTGWLHLFRIHALDLDKHFLKRIFKLWAAPEEIRLSLVSLKQEWYEEKDCLRKARRRHKPGVGGEESQAEATSTGDDYERYGQDFDTRVQMPRQAFPGRLRSGP